MFPSPLHHHDRDRPEELASELAATLPRVVAWIPVLYKASRGYYARWRVARRLENQVRVRLRSVRVSATDADVGRIDIAIEVVNFSGAVINVERAELHAVTIGSKGVQRLSEMLKASGRAAPHDVGHGHFGLDLTGADLRAAIEGIAPAANARSSPNATVQLTGGVLLEAKGKRWAAYFDTQLDCARFSIGAAAVAAHAPDG